MSLNRGSHHGLSRAIWSVRNGMQVAKMAYKGVKAFKQYRADRRAKKQISKVSPVVAKVKKTLGTINPAYANHKSKYYSKDTPTNQNRRKAFAKQLKKIPRKTRTKTGSFTPTSKFARKPYSGKIAIGKGMTGQQIKRNIVRHKIKKYTAEQVRNNMGNRQSAAQDIRAIRNKTRTKGYSKHHGYTSTHKMFRVDASDRLVKKAAHIISRLK